MRPFEYARPSTVEEAVRLLSAGGEPESRSAAVLSGGTDLLSLMKDDVESPGRLVALSGIASLSGIRPRPDGSFEIGAQVTLEELSTSAYVREGYPALAAAAGRLGSPQIRSQGTLGGNLCQRPRCWYYRQGFGLLGQQGGRSMVEEGDNRYHAILGHPGPAHFVSPSTLAPLLIVLGARLALQGPEEGRETELEAFFRVPSREGEREHDLAAGEIVTAVHLPSVEGWSVASYEVRPGQALDWSLATASVALELDGHIVRRARVVLGQVAPVPWRAREVEDLLAGQKLTLEMAEKAGALAVRGAQSLSRNGYKVQLARVAVRRALLQAVGLEA